MTRRPPAIAAGLVLFAVVFAACNGSSSAPTLTDPAEIVTAALKSTEGAKSVHIEVAVDGEAGVSLPIGADLGTSFDLTGTTASADIDFARPAAKATFSLPSLLGLSGEVIAVDGKSYVKTTLTGALYQESSLGDVGIDATPDPSATTDMIDDLGDFLLSEGIVLAKGDDVACGSKTCYAVSTTVDAGDLGSGAAGAVSDLPVDLVGATLALTVLVEQDAPNHLAGLTAEISLPDGTSITVDVIASKWDEPVAITAPPADQVKPAS
jgi:hypothetical protein